MIQAPVGIELENVTCRFGHRSAVEDFTLRIEPGECVAMLGPSGSGKSTVMNVIAGLVAPQTGRLGFFGGAGHIADPQRAVAFQDGALYDHLSVSANLAMARGSDTAGPGEKQWLAPLEIFPIMSRRASDLSGGERQRVALARVLVRAAPIALLDEPLGQLDRPRRWALRHHLRSWQRARGVTMLWISHDEQEASMMGDRVAVLYGARLAQCASWRELVTSPASRAVASIASAEERAFMPVRVASAPTGDVELSMPGARIAPLRLASGTLPESASAMLGPENLSVSSGGGRSDVSAVVLPGAVLPLRGRHEPGGGIDVTGPVVLFGDEPNAPPLCTLVPSASGANLSIQIGADV